MVEPLTLLVKLVGLTLTRNPTITFNHTVHLIKQHHQNLWTYTLNLQRNVGAGMPYRSFTGSNYNFTEPTDLYKARQPLFEWVGR